MQGGVTGPHVGLRYAVFRRPRRSASSATWCFETGFGG